MSLYIVLVQSTGSNIITDIVLSSPTRVLKVSRSNLGRGIDNFLIKTFFDPYVTPTQTIPYYSVKPPETVYNWSAAAATAAVGGSYGHSSRKANK